MDSDYLSHSALHKICLPKSLSHYLEEIIQVIDKSITQFDPAVKNLFLHYSYTYGKLIRSMLLLVSADLTGKVTDKHIRSACALELMHYASLIHDDIIDNATMRRGNPTLNVQWNDKTAVAAGDYILSTGFYLFSTLNDIFLSQKIASLMQTISSGELRQLTYPIVAENEYLSIIEQKTASLFGIATYLGCYLNGGGKNDCSQWEQIGTHLGMAFQIMDDILDLTPSSQTAGKNRGADVRCGLTTLPLIYYSDSLPEHEKHIFFQSLKSHALDIDKLWSSLVKKGICQKTAQKASTYINHAKTLLQQMRRNNNVSYTFFDTLSDYILNTFMY